MNQIIHSPIKTLKNLTCTILIISILPLILNPSVLIYLFFFNAIWFALFLSYGNRKNRFWLMNSLTIALGSAIAFVLIKFLTGCHVRSMTLPEISLLSLGALEVLIAAGLCIKAKEPCRLTRQPRLYEERNHDLERIREYIQEFEILGINAGWGMGKSFLMEHLKYHYRSGSTKQQLRGNALTNFLMTKTGVKWETASVSNVLIDELDKESFDIFRREALRSRRMSENDFNPKIVGVL